MICYDVRMKLRCGIYTILLLLCLSGHTLAKKPVYVETGTASWYGWQYAGQKTASGVRFWPCRRLAAHPFLPFGTKVKVTNLENGRSAWVLIADRGPVPQDRAIDLSRRTARKLGFLRQGLTRVKMEVHQWPQGAL